MKAVFIRTISRNWRRRYAPWRRFRLTRCNKLVRFANQENLSIVPFGGGSGLMGGALSVRLVMVIDLRRMNRILAIDSESRCARVQAGAVLEAVDLALNQAGFILGHDPWTVPVATIGGAISTNSVGYRAGIYGSMGEQVLGLEAVMPNGEVLRTRRGGKTLGGVESQFSAHRRRGLFRHHHRGDDSHLS